MQGLILSVTFLLAGKPKDINQIRKDEEIPLCAQKRHENIEGAVCGALIDYMKEICIESVKVHYIFSEGLVLSHIFLFNRNNNLRVNDPSRDRSISFLAF